MGFLFPKQQTASPERMPASEDAVVRAAQARQRKSMLERTGRTSTVMTRQAPGASGDAGTQSYQNSVLGSA